MPQEHDVSRVFQRFLVLNTNSAAIGLDVFNDPLRQQSATYCTQLFYAP